MGSNSTQLILWEADFIFVFCTGQMVSPLDWDGQLPSSGKKAANPKTVRKRARACVCVSM